MQRGGPTAVTWAPPLTLPLPAKAPQVWCLTPPYRASMEGETGPPNMDTANCVPQKTLSLQSVGIGVFVVLL